MSSIDPRDYQEGALVQVADGIRAGHKRQILNMPTGSGKTETAMLFIEKALEKGSKTAFICDRLSILYQTEERFDRHGFPFGVMQSGHYRFRPWEHLQLCSSQTLARRGIDVGFKFVVVDECFVAGTMVATPGGLKPIELVRSGDSVYNAFGIGIVLVRHSSPIDQRKIVRVRFSDGSEISCTEDHRFFTTDAWLQARELAGKSVITFEDMPSVWSEVCANSTQDGTRITSIRERKDVDGENRLFKVLLEESTEPYVLSKSAGQGIGIAKTHRAQASVPRRKRETDDESAKTAARYAWGRLGGGIYRDDPSKCFRRIPASLQGGRSKSAADDSNRSGRKQSSRDDSSGSGCEKRRAIGKLRVVSVQVEQCESDRVVYNLHVSGHPSYFANGVLVHNCHCLYKSTTNFLKAHPETITLGLSATPFTKGLGEIYSNVVNCITTNRLIEQGWLSPIHAFTAKTIDVKKVKIASTGEWDENDLTAKGQEIIGDIVQCWSDKVHELFGGPVKTIVFTPTVAYGAELCEKWRSAGYNFVQISYKDGNDGMRREILEDFRQPDTNITGLISCTALAKGFDVVDIRVGVDAHPYRKSLSSVIQQIGRVMRPHPSKEYALWIDHAGNIPRFHADITTFFEHGLQGLGSEHLDATARKEPTEKERHAMLCVKCGIVLSPRIETCPGCGHVRPRRKSGIEEVPGELVQIELGKNGKPMPEFLRDKYSVWAQIVEYSKSSKPRDRAEKFALAQYRSIYGSWPPRGSFHTVPAVECSQQVYNKIRHGIIAWARARKAA